MKFIAIKSNIKEAISFIEKAVSENNNLPILKNILIEAKEGIITFTATNLEIAVKYQLAGKIIEDGKVAPPFSLFSNLINNIQSDRLNFEQKGNDIEVATDNYSAVVHGLSPEDFPITPTIQGNNKYIEIKGVFLKEAIQQTITASQYSDLRPELNSVLLNYSIDNLVMAATDGFRLAEKTLPPNLFTTKEKEPFRILIPLKTAIEMARVTKEEENVKIFWDENQVLLKTESTELISRLTEGNFPDYSAIIPHEFATEIVVNKEELTNAIKLAGVFGQKNGEIKIKIHENNKAIEMSSADQSLGENNHTIAAKIKGNNKQEIYFNWRYLSDPMKSIKTEDVFIGLQEESGPALIRSTSDSSYYYVLRPILKS